jgi:hypothetical protein
VGDSITASNKPTIAASNTKSQDSSIVSEWGAGSTFAAGDVLGFNVDSCTAITRVTISLKITKA